MRPMNKALFSLLPILALSLSACSGKDGKDGPPGPQGAGGNTVSAVLPAAGFAGRSATLTVLGSGTSWTSASVPSFGAGVTVNSTRVLSPTAIIVDVTYSATAEAGDRDVTITTAGEVTTLSKALSLKLPVEVESVLGTVAQGSLISVTLKNNDNRENPFDTASSSDFLGNTSFTGMAIESSVAGISLNPGSVTRDAATFTGTIDASFVAGKTDLSVFSGPEGAAVESLVPGALTVAARSPKPLTSGTDFAFTPAATLASELVSLTAGQLGLSSWTISGAGAATAISPTAYILDSTGSFSKALGQVGVGAPFNMVQDANAVVHAVLFDAKGATSAITLTPKLTAFASSDAAETEPNDTTAAAQTVGALPYMMNSATLGTLTDVDTYRLVLAAGAKVSLLTLAKDTTAKSVDTLVKLVAADGTTVIATSDDKGYFDTLEQTLAAGTYFVKVSYSTEATAPVASAYRFVVNPL